MIRSMMSGISGLRNHQTAMDVIGNNISNVNTTGFKASRVTFSSVFSSTVANATAPSSDTGTGGTNPMQIGMGAGIASIDMLYTGGNIERTDNPLDVSIDGNGLFIIKSSDASSYTFTRAGAFGIDKQGNLITSTGAKVCGWTRRTQSEDAIEADGFDSTMDVEPINVYMDKYNGDKRTIKPQSTTDVEFSGNLNANSNTDDVVNIPMSLYDNYGYEVQANLRLVKKENLSHSNTVIKGPGNPLINGYQTGTYVKPVNQTNTIYTEVVSGEFYAIPTKYLGNTIEATGANGFTPGTIVNKKFIVPEGTKLADVIESADANNINAGKYVKDDGTGTNTYVECNAGDPGAKYVVPDGTGNMIIEATAENGLTPGQLDDGTYVIPYGVTTLDTAECGIAPGKYVKVETETEIVGYTEVSSTTTGALKVLDDETQLSINAWTYTITVNDQPVKDAMGNPITGEVVFGNGENEADDYGKVTSLTDGLGNRVGDFKLALDVNYDNKPDNVAKVNFDFSALTQYAAKNSASVYKSNGYPTGKLQEYSIGNDGVITGIYSNGKQQALGMIALANFDNPAGLKSIGDSSYTQTANSGDFRATVPGAEAGSLAANTLEMSNVDLSTEFTNMIVFQRGFQANSRTITTADEMLQELVNLKR